MSPEFTDVELDVAQGKPRPKGKLSYLLEGEQGRDPEFLRAWLTKAFRPLPALGSFETFERPTTESSDGCSITFRNGRDTRTYRFRRQGDLTGAKLRSTVLSVGQGDLAMPHLTGTEIEDVWAAMCTLGSVLTEYDDRDEIRKWVEQMLTGTLPLNGYTLGFDGRYDALMAIRTAGEFTKPDALALLNGHRDDRPEWLRRPIRFIDSTTGEQWLRAGETATYLRYVLGAEPLTHVTLRGRLREIGVEAKHFQARNAPHPSAWLYRLSDELVEFVGGGKGVA